MSSGSRKWLSASLMPYGRLEGTGIPPGASAPQRLAHEDEAVVAEVEVVAVDDDRRRTESAARDELVGVGAELLLDLRRGEARQERLWLEAGALRHVGEDLRAGEVAVLAPVGLEGRARELDAAADLEGGEDAAH